MARVLSRDRGSQVEHPPKDTRQLDLAGRTVIPGLSDSHVHAQGDQGAGFAGLGAATFTDAQIGEARTVAEILAIIAEAAAKKAPGEWVVVSGDLRHTRIKEGATPPAPNSTPPRRTARCWSLQATSPPPTRWP